MPLFQVDDAADREGKLLTQQYPVQFAAEDVRERRDLQAWLREKPGAIDPDERIKQMDGEGIDIALLFPTIGICWEGACSEPEISAYEAEEPGSGDERSVRDPEKRDAQKVLAGEVTRLGAMASMATRTARSPIAWIATARPAAAARATSARSSSGSNVRMPRSALPSYGSSSAAVCEPSAPSLKNFT